MGKNRGHQKKRTKNKAAAPEEIILARRIELAHKAEIASFFIRLIVVIPVLIVIFGCIYGITPMRNDDMKPRISAGDLMLYYRMEDNPAAQDVIIFEKDGVQYAGRVIGKAGDKIEITKDAALKINDSIVVEADIFYTTPLYESPVQYPMMLGENQFFVLCDYRQGAKDSRYFGVVELSEIKGKVITVIRRSGL